MPTDVIPRSKVISYATKCNLGSTVETYNKVVRYRPAIHSNSVVALSPRPHKKGQQALHLYSIHT